MPRITAPAHAVDRHLKNTNCTGSPTVPGDASLDVHHLLLGAASASELEWSDFAHAAADRDHVERLLNGAVDSGASGRAYSYRTNGET